MDLSLICVRDRVALRRLESAFACPECGRRYEIRDGVVCVLEQTDEFYEGAYENQVLFLPRSEKPWHVWPLWLINSGFLWAVRRYVPGGSTVVELGCAGGVRYFGHRYRMIGCDLSLSALKRAEFYAHRVRSDASVCIPLPDGSVDAVVCSYFWEHISPASKPDILKECRRILKKGGKLVFLYDVGTENPLIRRYKRIDARLYDTLFIKGDGHFGYEPPRANLSAFEQSGFRVLQHSGMEKTWLQSPSCYLKLARFSSSSRRLFQWTAVLQRSPWFYPYTALVRVVDALICPWLPEEWARMDMVVCEKEQS